MKQLHYFNLALISVLMAVAPVSRAGTVTLPASADSTISTVGNPTAGEIPFATDTTGDSFNFGGPSWNSTTSTFSTPASVSVGGKATFTEANGVGAVQFGVGDSTNLPDSTKNCLVDANGRIPANCAAGVATGASPPATCTVGDLFMDTDETDDTVKATTSDNVLLVCGTTNTWVVPGAS